MFPGRGMDPKQLERMMKQLGIKTEEVKAKRAVFELENGSRIVIESPSITSMTMQGKKTFTVMGNEKQEQRGQEQQGIQEEDIEMVMQQAGASREEAKKALEENQGDIAKAIMELKE